MTLTTESSGNVSHNGQFKNMIYFTLDNLI